MTVLKTFLISYSYRSNTPNIPSRIFFSKMLNYNRGRINSFIWSLLRYRLEKGSIPKMVPYVAKLRRVSLPAEAAPCLPWWGWSYLSQKHYRDLMVTSLLQLIGYCRIDGVWLLRIGHKRFYIFHFVPSEIWGNLDAMLWGHSSRITEMSTWWGTEFSCQQPALTCQVCK